MPLDYATCRKWVGYVPGFLHSSFSARRGQKDALEGPGSGSWRPREAPTGPKWSQNAPRRRLQNDLKIEFVLGAVLEAVWRREKGRSRIQAAIPAAGRRNGGGLRGGIKGGGLKPCKELLHLNLTRPSARWAGGFKRLTPFRRPPEEEEVHG